MLDAERRVVLLFEARRLLLASDILKSTLRLADEFQLEAPVNDARVQVLLLDERQQEAEAVTLDDLALVDLFEVHPVANTFFLLFAERVDRSDGTQHDDAGDLGLVARIEMDADENRLAMAVAHGGPGVQRDKIVVITGHYRAVTQFSEGDIEPARHIEVDVLLVNQ